MAKIPVTVILASSSRTRSAMLEAAGIEFTSLPPGIDEESLKEELERRGSKPAEIATALAAAKGSAVSVTHPEALVIGADQILVCEDQRFDKPPDVDAARMQLLTLRGRTHTLVTAASVSIGQSVAWSHVEQAHLTMRDFSDEFLSWYLAAAGEDVTRSVGAYKVEGLGLHLFSAIEGDHYTILGLPMLPLLAFLRDQGSLRA